jgi:hypothetical protein
LLFSCLLFAVVSLPALLGVGMPAVGVTPELYLWAWQRSEDLTFIDPATTKVALWVGSISVEDGRVDVTPRQNPVIYPEGTELLSVVRVDVDANYDSAFADRLAQVVHTLVAPVTALETQIDFDARVSQRVFYRELLDGVRARMPGRRLSVTALASWCLGDPWLDALPIDAAVPMLYRMGNDGPRIRQYLSEQGQLPATICEDNIGYSTDEPAIPVRGVKRIFWYHPTAWTTQTFAEAQAAFGAKAQ